MSRLGSLIKREEDQRRDIVGRVVTQRELRNFEATASPVWVCSVDIGRNRLLENVPIRAVNGNRFYAEMGAAVFLRREANGRLYVSGPVNRSRQPTSVKTYTIGNPTAQTASTLGFTFSPVPFEYYEGTGPPSGSFWNDGVTPFPLVQVLDGDGNPV
jgi:hypothetical protein